MQQISKGSARAGITSAAVALLLAIAAFPAVASANITPYFQGWINPGVSGRQTDITRTLLTSSGVNSNCSNCQIWAGAHYSGSNTLYASWATGVGEACHNYGTSNIGAMIEAPYSGQDIFLAVSGWQGDQGASYC